MFKDLIKQKYKHCYTKEDYANFRNELEIYGIDNFYNEMNIFKDGYIDSEKDVFAKIIENLDDNFLLIDSLEGHKLLLPRILEWDSFNVLTLSKKHKGLLENMKEVAKLYVEENQIENYGLYFHCYPFNSVNSLHLHIVKEPKFKYNNLDIDIVLETI